MKKILFLMFVLLAIATTAGAQRGVAINSTNFPSTNFRKFVKDNYDKDGDNFLSDAEIAAVTKINVYGKSIGDLKGIERFTALKELDCRKNGLLELDLSKNTALTRLLCSSNSLNVLDVSQNTALTELECSENKLTRLNVSENTALTELWCDINQIKAPAMRKLLESLPEVSRGTLGVIDTKSSNEQNVITVPQVAIAKGKGWTVLDLNGGSSYIPYAGSDPGLEINETNFPDENFRSCVLDNSIDKDEDGYLSDEERSLRGLGLGLAEGNIASLKGIELFTELEELYCWDNQLTSLDLSHNTKLVELNCSFNQLTSLDLSKNTALRILRCYNNQLTSLDLSQNTKLYQLACDNNQLTSLDLSHNTKLFQLGCGNNQLTSLDVSKNTALRVLFCHGNQIKGAKMQALVNSLPTASGVDGKFYVIDSKGSNEGNVITKSQVAIAKGKSWKVYDYNTVDGGGHRPVEYDGSDPGSDPIPYKLELAKGVNIVTSLSDYAVIRLAVEKTDVFTVEEGESETVILKSKKTGKTLMTVYEGAFLVPDNVTSADNIEFDITAADHALLKSWFEEEDPLEGYDKVTLSFVALTTEDLIISFPKKVNTPEELNIDALTIEMALSALIFWEKLQSFKDDETGDLVIATMSGKDLFQVGEGNVITVFDDVTSADNIVYTITDKNREDLKKETGYPFDLFANYKTIQIKFEFGTMGIGGVEADGLDKAAWYTLDGKKLSGEPTRKGVYIYKGRKVVK